MKRSSSVVSAPGLCLDRKESERNRKFRSVALQSSNRARTTKCIVRISRIVRCCCWCSIQPSRRRQHSQRAKQTKVENTSSLKTLAHFVVCSVRKQLRTGAFSHTMLCNTLKWIWMGISSCFLSPGLIVHREVKVVATCEFARACPPLYPQNP